MQSKVAIFTVLGLKVEWNVEKCQTINQLHRIQQERLHENTDIFIWKGFFESVNNKVT